MKKLAEELQVKFLFTYTESRSYRKNTVPTVNVKVLYKNHEIITVYTQEILKNTMDVHVETKTKLIKKFKLPYTKTYITEANKKHDNIKSRYNKQLNVGPSFVRTVLNGIVNEYKTHGILINRILSTRVTGVASKQNKDRRIDIKIKSRKV